MGREPFATPAERSAQAMAKMTPGTLRGASRIATPGRAVGRPKRVPATAPLFTPFFGMHSRRPLLGGSLSDEYISDVTWTMVGLRVTGTNPSGSLLRCFFTEGTGDGFSIMAMFDTADVDIDVTIPPTFGPQDIYGLHQFGCFAVDAGAPDDFALDFWAFTDGADFAQDDAFVQVGWPHE